MATGWPCLAEAACRWQGDDLLLRLYIQPRSSRDEIVGIHGDELKVRITAPPVEGKANAHLLKFLAREFGVSRRRVVLRSGESGRHKQVLIQQPARLPSPLQRPDPGSP
jgi:uncharacterized protein (TIGR00251 family)